MKNTLKLLLLMGVGMLAARPKPIGGLGSSGTLDGVPAINPRPDAGAPSSEGSGSASRGEGDASSGGRSDADRVDVMTFNVDGSSVSLVHTEIARASELGRVVLAGSPEQQGRLVRTPQGQGLGPLGRLVLRDLDEPRRTQMESIFEALEGGSLRDLDRAMAGLANGSEGDRRFLEVYERFSAIHDDPAYQQHRDSDIETIQERDPHLARRVMAEVGVLVGLVGNPTTGFNPTLGDVFWATDSPVIQEMMDGSRPKPGPLDVPFPGQGDRLEQGQGTAPRRRENESDEEYRRRTGVTL